MRQLKITVGEVVIRAELLDTPTAVALHEAAPFEAGGVDLGRRGVLSHPDLVRPRGRRPRRGRAGRARVGRTAMRSRSVSGAPRSRAGDECRLASPCNIWGKALDDVKALRSVRPGAAIKVERGAG